MSIHAVSQSVIRQLDTLLSRSPTRDPIENDTHTWSCTTHLSPRPRIGSAFATGHHTRPQRGRGHDIPSHRLTRSRVGSTSCSWSAGGGELRWPLSYIFHLLICCRRRTIRTHIESRFVLHRKERGIRQKEDNPAQCIQFVHSVGLSDRLSDCRTY